MNHKSRSLGCRLSTWSANYYMLTTMEGLVSESTALMVLKKKFNGFKFFFTKRFGFKDRAGVDVVACGPHGQKHFWQIKSSKHMAEKFAKIHCGVFDGKQIGVMAIWQEGLVLRYKIFRRPS